MLLQGQFTPAGMYPGTHMLGPRYNCPSANQDNRNHSNVQDNETLTPRSAIMQQLSFTTGTTIVCVHSTTSRVAVPGSVPSYTMKYENFHEWLVSLICDDYIAV